MQKTVQVYDRQFKQYSRDAIHPKISAILSEFPRGTLLDFPAGSGALSYRLHRDGFSVTACDIHPEHFEPNEIEVVRGDLGSQFPFDDNSFDYATFVEGPEHAENPFFAIREYARVLKPGGRLVLSLPNYTNIEKRLEFLLYGSSEKAVSQDRFKEHFVSDMARLHITPLIYTQLKFFLEYAGFEIELLEKDGIKRNQRFLKPLALLLQLASKLHGKSGREKYWLHEANSDTILMGGNTLIIVACLQVNQAKAAA